MEVILLDYIEKVGDKHEVVKVKNGYGRNYLIPKGLAIVANKNNMARLEGLKKQFAKKESAKVDTYRDYADKLASITLKIVAKAGETGRLFGSVKAQHLIDTIKEELGFEIERRVIQMPEEVKELGSYEAIFKFHEEVSVPVKFEVVRDKSEDTDDTPAIGTRKSRKIAERVEAPAAAPAEEAKMESTEAPMEEAVEEAVATIVEEAAEEPAAPEAAAEEPVATVVEEAVAEEPAAAAVEEAAEEETVEATAEADDAVEAEAEQPAEVEEAPAEAGDEEDTDKAA